MQRGPRMNKKNPKKDVMKKEAKNFPGDKEAQVKVSEWNISMSSTEDFVTDLDAAEALVKMVSESGDTPILWYPKYCQNKIIQKQVFLDCLRKEKLDYKSLYALH